MPEGRLSYQDAGVDREKAGHAKRRIGELVRDTLGPEVVANPGGFGGLYRLPQSDGGILVASADGVGTKLKVAILAGRHETVGEDLVNHCVDDILVEGARPLFFLDYLGMGALEPGVVEAIVAGVARGCRANGCALLGGETAELPSMYAKGDYDLAGFIVGLTREAERPGAHRVQAGNTLLGLASNGFHTNGYSLLRRLLLQDLGLGLDDRFPDMAETVAEVLLRVHRSYREAVHPLIVEGRVHALAHITGGGIVDNLARVLPRDADARVRRGSWRPPPEFLAVQQHGRISDREMYLTFNMGIGLILIVEADEATALIHRLRAGGERAWPIGEVVPGTGRVVLDE
ncbi:MAG: phosphoribosylformylglycinamidine cyclo-ligase [Longimicrobiales bacterium]